MKMATELKSICDRLNVKFIFKSSFDKAIAAVLNLIEV